jgi:hypothetical protein
MWWQEFRSRVSSPAWVADVGVLTFLAIVTIAVAVWVLRRQLRSEAAARAAEQNREKSQGIGKMLIELGEEMGESRSHPDFFPPAHNDIFWGANRFPGAPIMGGDRVDTAWGQDGLRRHHRTTRPRQRLWYCCRSPVLPQERWVDQDKRIAFVHAWTRSRETGLYPVAQCLYWAGRALREWDGTLPWRESPLLNLVKRRLYGAFPGEANMAELARQREPRTMELHVGRTERALREAGLEHMIPELEWPQAGEGAIEHQIRDERLFNDLPGKTLTPAARLDTSACRSQSQQRQNQNRATPAWESSSSPGHRSSQRSLKYAPLMRRRTPLYATILAIATIAVAVWVLRRPFRSENSSSGRRAEPREGPGHRQDAFDCRRSPGGRMSRITRRRTVVIRQLMYNACLPADVRHGNIVC